MDTITHQQLVTALVKPPLEIMTTLSQFSTDLWHGATGVSGECGELLEMIWGDRWDQKNFVEEMGDILFYMEQVRQRAGIERNTQADKDSNALVPLASPKEYFGDRYMLDRAIDLAVLGSQVLDTIKKCAIYNKPLALLELGEYLYNMDVKIGAMLNLNGVTRQEVLDANIAKLSKRYAGLSYSDKAAQQRADKEPQRKPFPGEPTTI